MRIVVLRLEKPSLCVNRRGPAVAAVYEVTMVDCPACQTERSTSNVTLQLALASKKSASLCLRVLSVLCYLLQHLFKNAAMSSVLLSDFVLCAYPPSK